MNTQRNRARKGSWRTIAGAAIVSISAACAERAQSPYVPLDPGPHETTVLVRNTGITAVAVYANDDPSRIGTVLPGRTECLDLRFSSAARHLIARPIGGGESTISPRFEVRPGEGWQWSVGSSPVDRLSLVPRAQCDRTP